MRIGPKRNFVEVFRMIETSASAYCPELTKTVQTGLNFASVSDDVE